MHGGNLIASVLVAQGVRFVFTLVGGHISPILVGAKQQGIRVVDTRHEATAVFAADAVARLTGKPGVAVVTAGPGVTNTITAVKNAQMAQSPVILIGGAAPTALQGRGALQDIEQIALFKSVTKWAQRVSRVRDLAPTLEKAFRIAQEGVPEPVFIECPIDLLYPEAMIRKLYGADRGGKTLADRAVKWYLNYHVNRLFAGSDKVQAAPAITITPPLPDPTQVRQVAERLRHAQRPLLLVGSQATLQAAKIEEIAASVTRLGIPVYLSGMARGLLGRDHPLQLRHKRREALREADLVILAGVPCDFRLDYGNHIRRSTYYISINRSRRDLSMNRRPSLGVLGDPGQFLCDLAQVVQPGERWGEWREQLNSRDADRNTEIQQQMLEPLGKLNPLHLCGEIDKSLAPNAIVIADGGDFVATAAYILQPPGPLTWLDPGAFGTLGVGAGFALGAKLVHPEAEVWILYGDGSAGYSLSEFDTFARHGLPVIGVVGNDASWAQIAREQVEILQDDVATVLAHTDYHRVAEGLGANGLLLDDPELIPERLQEAKELAAAGKPVLVNAILGKSGFRKGSISM